MVIHKDTAMSWSVKRATLVAEVFRRLYNTDCHTPWQERADFVSRLVVKMWRSGYNGQDVACFVKGGVRRYEKILGLQTEGVRPMYRDGEYKREERWREKLTNKLSWSNADSVLFLPSSNRLKRVAQESVKFSRENIRVVERGGTSIKSLLQRSDPSRDPLCGDDQCWICHSENEDGGQKQCLKGSCSSSNVGYVITCLSCQKLGLNRVYEGESGRAAKARATEHQAAIRRKLATSPLYQHIQTDHSRDEVQPLFKFQVRQRFKDALTRQVEEGVRIENIKEEDLLNNKQEWVPPALGRVRLE